MKKNDKDNPVSSYITCIGANAKNLWLIGISVIALATLFCFAIFSNRAQSVQGQDPAAPVMVMGAPGQQAALPGANCFTCPSFNQCFPQGSTNAQQVALANPNCFTCPSFNQCFPQGATGAQQVALPGANCFTCPSFNQCFPQGTTGGAQQVALANPNCFTCPSFNQCFPQGATGAQQVAFGRGNGFLSCPFCRFLYNDADAGMRGGSRCPRCFGTFPFSGFNNRGFTNIAMTQPIPAPPIFRDAVMPHEYRGVCENCHQIKPDIAIPANAQMPHEYRGVCSNCHTILGAKAGAQ